MLFCIYSSHIKYMRDVKFRIWNGHKIEYNIVAGKLGAFYAIIDPNDSACLNPTSKYYSDTPLMEFTGLFDKNKNEIYEGDIIKQRHFEDWSDVTGYDYFGFVKHRIYNDANGNQFSGYAIFTLENENSGFAGCSIKIDCEVVGNIFDNINLLKI